MTVMPKLAGCLMLATVLTATVGETCAQTAFRPDRASNIVETSEHLRSYRQILRIAGLTEVDLDTTAPLPEARTVMDELVANGNLRDDLLASTWRDLGDITAAIDAAWPSCELTGFAPFNTQLARMEDLGRHLDERLDRLTALYESVFDLYVRDQRLFSNTVGGLASQADVDSMERGMLKDQGLEVGSRVAQEVGVLSALGLRLLQGYSILSAAISVTQATIASYDSYRAVQRLPHVLEKYEISLYLAALTEQYQATIAAINHLGEDVRKRLRHDCHCLSDQIAAQVRIAEDLPESDEQRWRRLTRRIARMRAEGGNGYRIVELEQEAEETFQGILTANRARDAAARRWREAVADGPEQRAAYERHRARQGSGD